jgi:hypothetical protein
MLAGLAVVGSSFDAAGLGAAGGAGFLLFAGEDASGQSEVQLLRASAGGDEGECEECFHECVVWMLELTRAGSPRTAVVRACSKPGIPRNLKMGT